MGGGGVRVRVGGGGAVQKSNHRLVFEKRGKPDYPKKNPLE